MVRKRQHRKGGVWCGCSSLVKVSLLTIGQIEAPTVGMVTRREVNGSAVRKNGRLS